MVMAQTDKKSFVMIFGALIFIILTAYLWHGNSSAAIVIKQNNKDIKQLQTDKDVIYKELKESEKELKAKDELISRFTNIERKLLKQRKTQQNEVNENRFNYLNSANDERVKLFTRLATEKN